MGAAEQYAEHSLSSESPALKSPNISSTLVALLNISSNIIRRQRQEGLRYTERSYPIITIVQLLELNNPKIVGSYSGPVLYIC